MSLAAPASPRVALLTALVLACLCAAGGFAPGRSRAGLPHAAAARAAESHHLRKLALTTKDLVVDSHTQTIYVSVPSSVGAGGNSITPINAQTGTPGQPVFIGSEPGDLAIADSGEAVYAVLEGASAVRRFDTRTQTAGVQFNLGNDSFSGPVMPRQIKVAPGNPEIVAVQGGGSMFESRLFIFDNGVRRGNSLASAAQQLEFSASATRLYSSSSGTSVHGEFIGLQRINLTPTGPSNDGNASQVPAQTGEIKFDNGRLYAASGHVYNPENGALLGQFTAPDIVFLRTTVVPDSAVSAYLRLRVLLQRHAEDNAARLRMNTFAEIGSIEIPDASGTPTSLARWGANGLAFRTETAVHLIQTTLIPSGESVPSPTPTPSTTPTPVPTPTPTPLSGELREITITTNDLVVDAQAQMRYASVPSRAGASGNSITPIDPVAGVAGAPVFVGSEPRGMAISDDGQFIYVGLDGENAVRRFEVAARTAGPKFELGGETPVRVGDISVAPGQPETFAVARLTPGGNDRGVAVYEGGVARARTGSRSSGIEFSGSPFVLYGNNGFDSGAEFNRMGVGSCGVSVLSATRGLGAGSDFKFANGRVYSSGGRVIDPEAGNVIGVFGGLDRVVRSVLPDPKAGRVYFIEIPNVLPSRLRLHVYDSETFLLIGVLDLANIPTNFGEQPSSLVRWGANGLAFRNANKVYLLQHNLIGGTSPTFTPAPTPAPPTVSLRGRITDFNGGVGGVSVALSGSLTTSTTTDTEGNFTIPGVGICDVVTVTPSKPTYTFGPASVEVLNPVVQPSLNITAFPEPAASRSRSIHSEPSTVCAST